MKIITFDSSFRFDDPNNFWSDPAFQLQPGDPGNVGGHGFIKWGWGGYGQYLDSGEIWVDRGDGKGFVFLTIDTTPNYTDTTAPPAVPAKWTYKATYRAGENQVGLWSAPVSITVCA